MASTKSPTSRLSESAKVAAASPRRLDLDHRDVGVVVGADAGGRQRAAIDEPHRDAVGLVDDMAVGDDEAALGVEHHAGA
jgi:hypothetical protein